MRPEPLVLISWDVQSGTAGYDWKCFRLWLLMCNSNNKHAVPFLVNMSLHRCLIQTFCILYANLSHIETVTCFPRLHEPFWPLLVGATTATRSFGPWVLGMSFLASVSLALCHWDSCCLTVFNSALHRSHGESLWRSRPSLPGAPKEQSMKQKSIEKPWKTHETERKWEAMRDKTPRHDLW